MAAAVPVHQGRHHLRRFRRNTARRHCQPSARPAEGAPMTPEYPTGHALLAGKIAVVTAAAGTGIGSATARRCLEEGASVVVSDWHERRLAETAAALADEIG